MASLKVLSWNMQAGIGTRSYRDYALRWHEQVSRGKKGQRLVRAAETLGAYDVVALQECDFGSWRSGGIHQGDWLAKSAGFSHAHYHLSRRMAPVAGSGLALLSRYPMEAVVGHRLPSLIPGRGALEARILVQGNPLHLLVVHLSLGKRDRARQLQWIQDWRLRQPAPCVVMGDFNASADCSDMQKLIEVASCQATRPSFPSWRPQRAIDHVLVFGAKPGAIEVVDPLGSDHLALSREVRLA